MNIYRDSNIALSHFGGTTMSCEFPNFQRQENWYCINAGQASILAQVSLPDGNYPPVTWRMPLKAGAISSRNKMNGSGSVTANTSYGVAILAALTGSGRVSSALPGIGIAILAAITGSGRVSSATPGTGIAIYSDMTGSGGVSSAVAALISQIRASIAGTGGINSPHILAYLNALAHITGMGEVTEADLAGIGKLLSDISGEGYIEPTLTAKGELSAAIKSYGTLTPEGIRDMVWQAAATSFDDEGTMGKKLNDAGTASNPWDTVFGTMTAGEMFEAIFKLTHNKVTKSGNIITIYEDDGVTVWSQFDLSSGGRVKI